MGLQFRGGVWAGCRVAPRFTFCKISVTAILGLLLICGCTEVAKESSGNLERQPKRQESVDRKDGGQPPVPQKTSKKKPSGPLRPGQVQQSSTGADMAIRLHEPRIGKIKVTDPLREETESDEDYLSIRVTVNNNSKSRKLEYTGAGDNLFLSKARLTDDLGNNYRAINFGLGSKVVGQQGRRDSIYPGDRIEDLYVFEPPVDDAKELTLTIDGDALGQSRDRPFEARFLAPHR